MYLSYKLSAERAIFNPNGYMFATNELNEGPSGDVMMLTVMSGWNYTNPSREIPVLLALLFTSPTH